MSIFDDNPFADSNEVVNPFSDPSIQRATQPPAAGGGIIDDYNPFENPTQAGVVQPTPAPTALPPDPAKRHQQQAADAVRNNQSQQQPAVMQPVDPAAKVSRCCLSYLILSYHIKFQMDSLSILSVLYIMFV